MNNHTNGHANGKALLATQELVAPSPALAKLNGAQARTHGHTNGNGHFEMSRLKPEALVPRLGDYLIELGVLRHEALSHALQEQRRRSQEGRQILLGQLLVELGYVDRETLDHAVTMQVMELHNALANQNQRLEIQVAERTRQLKEALEHATSLQQHKDEFVGAISHELRTPLTIIVGFLDLLTREEAGAISPAQVDILNHMQLASDRLLHLVNNLLFFATLYEKELTIYPEPHLVTDLFSSALKKSIGAARDRDIRLLVKITPTMPCVWADVERIEWVVTELIENAIKFNSRGGEVRLVGRPGPNTTYEILVQDNGPGICEEQLESIFEPFRQLDGSLSRRAGGMGLGLALAQGIVEAHDSELWMRSEPGKGTQIGFSLELVTE